MIQKILKAIELAKTITYSELATRATARGLTLDELDDLLSKVGKNKNVKATVVKDEIVYKWHVPLYKNPNPHLTWVRNNYPVMTTENDGHGLIANYDYLFLTPAEMKQFKADAKGIPLHMMGKTFKKKKTA